VRILSALALAVAAAGCGQTGPLYLPDKDVETPIEIRAPGTMPAPSPVPPAEEQKEKKEDKATQPPGR
jgi:predicted small lipoprotein YifL